MPDVPSAFLDYIVSRKVKLDMRVWAASSPGDGFTEWPSVLCFEERKPYSHIGILTCARACALVDIPFRMETLMIHENWIPIEQFDKKAETEVQHLFMTASQNPKTGQVYFSLDAGCWADWGVFYNGDAEFEPTHYLDPRVWRKET